MLSTTLCGNIRKENKKSFGSEFQGLAVSVDSETQLAIAKGQEDSILICTQLEMIYAFSPNFDSSVNWDQWLH